MLGTDEKLIANCFWRLEEFKEFGLFVCTFIKDCAYLYVVIDDRIPVFESNGKVVFGQCKDPNELWVPLLEKAYAKIHGCYKSLIGEIRSGLSSPSGPLEEIFGSTNQLI